jgi:predicted phage gp36 major capsid-like protein
MADETPPFTLDELARRCSDAARAEIGAINQVEFVAASGGTTLFGEVVADIRRQAAALALSGRVMEQLKANPGMALGLDLTELMMIDRQLDGESP